MDALQEQINKGIRMLKEGSLVAFPTDTVYGLGADAFKSKAVERIYQVKKRPKNLPLPLLIADISRVTDVAQPMSKPALFLAQGRAV